MAKDWNRYEPTAARKRANPGRTVRPNTVTIDIHSHIAVPEAAAFVQPHLDLATIPLAHFATPQTKGINQQQEADRRSRMLELDDRLADLDAMGIGGIRRPQTRPIRRARYGSDAGRSRSRQGA
jgi:aminocarboxymuconate-semialdehyde decarboxylase